MATRKEMIETRSLKRLNVQKGTIAALHDQKYKLGPVIDITRMGLAFRYVNKEEEMKSSPVLSLFLTAKAFRLRKVPFRIIYDIEDKFRKPVDSLTVRRCGGQFGKLTKYQEFALKLFIKNYTIAKLNNKRFHIPDKL